MKKIIYDKNLCIDNCINDDYYRYEYNNTCYDKIPSGFYCNDTEHKILDKCHENCKECKGPPKIDNNNCLSCQDTDKKYLNLGNCINNCENGFFIDRDNNKVCKCIHNKKCYFCNEESNSLD